MAGAARPASTSRSTSTSAIRSIAPGVGTPVKGGLDYREAHMLMEMVADSGPAAGARPRGGQPDPRRSQHDGRSRRRAGFVRARPEDPVSCLERGTGG